MRSCEASDPPVKLRPGGDAALELAPASENSLVRLDLVIPFVLWRGPIGGSRISYRFEYRRFEELLNRSSQG